jgi:hypothetical protein
MPQLSLVVLIPPQYFIQNIHKPRQLIRPNRPPTRVVHPPRREQLQPGGAGLPRDSVHL